VSPTRTLNISPQIVRSYRVLVRQCAAGKLQGFATERERRKVNASKADAVDQGSASALALLSSPE
jgi:hypothetical protein